jgi:hypothetical protein
MRESCHIYENKSKFSFETPIAWGQLVIGTYGTIIVTFLFEKIVLNVWIFSPYSEEGSVTGILKTALYVHVS